MAAAADDDVQVAVIDNGSGTIRAGVAGDDVPRTEISCGTGDAASRTRWVGDEAQCKRGVLTLQQPIERGLVTNWDAMEAVWHHVFSEALHMKPEEHPVLLTEAPLNPKASREKMTQLMFETFNAPAFFTASGPVLALYASGRGTGLVVASGEGVTHTVPVFEGHALPHAIQRLELGGRDLTSLLGRLLGEQGISPPMNALSDPRFLILRALKEKHCYVAPEQDAWGRVGRRPFPYWNNALAQGTLFPRLPGELRQALFRLVEGTPLHRCELPPSHVAYLADECFRVPEALFQPSLVGMESAPGIHEATYQTIRACDGDIRMYLLGAVVLAGGTTLFPGIADRMHKALTELAPERSKIKVIAPLDRGLSSWIGGSILGSLSTFGSMCISKAEYAENGSKIVHRKCW